MKIIALLTFKNEEWILKEYINSINKIADLIIAYDDNSTDNSRLLLEEAGALIIQKDYRTESYFAEFNIRKELLKKGRELGGTHFVCLDADEIFSKNFISSGKKIISTLKPKQSLWLDWINLYEKINLERVDGLYKKISKSFIFCDHPDLDFSYTFVGVSRTPNTEKQYRIFLSRENGSVIHFQFLNTERSSIKRVWYMCSELIKADRSARRINATYEIQKNNKAIKTRLIQGATEFEISENFINEYDFKKDWRFLEILRWFDKYNIVFFEDLDIWDNVFLKDEFVKKTNRLPIPKKNFWLILKLNDLKNKLKNFLNSL